MKILQCKKTANTNIWWKSQMSMNISFWITTKYKKKNRFIETRYFSAEYQIL